MTTLEEALRLGRGVERPFRCPVHDDTTASASVNVVKGLWYCYACHAKGAVDEKRIPTMAELYAMLEPEKAVRVYPEGWLALFEDPIYWRQRFPDWLCWYARLGEDPVTGDATFPVFTPQGKLAGVGRRLQEIPVDERGKPTMGRYLYPPRWAASRVLHGQAACPPGEAVLLVEGAADAHSLWEPGMPALGCYGAGLHYPQWEMLARRNPKLVLLGFDMDKAGRLATVNTKAVLGDRWPTMVVEWPEKDPAACTVEQRVAAVRSVVGDRYVAQWETNREAMVRSYQDREE